MCGSCQVEATAPGTTVMLSATRAECGGSAVHARNGRHKRSVSGARPPELHARRRTAAAASITPGDEPVRPPATVRGTRTGATECPQRGAGSRGRRAGQCAQHETHLGERRQTGVDSTTSLRLRRLRALRRSLSARIFVGEAGRSARRQVSDRTCRRSREHTATKLTSSGNSTRGHRGSERARPAARPRSRSNYRARLHAPLSPRSLKTHGAAARMGDLEYRTGLDAGSAITYGDTDNATRSRPVAMSAPALMRAVSRARPGPWLYHGGGRRGPRPPRRRRPCQTRGGARHRTLVRSLDHGSRARHLLDSRRAPGRSTPAASVAGFHVAFIRRAYRPEA
jgi:hypothetical protein